jgi:ParB-like chromosome segregation protein Spo0J
MTSGKFSTVAIDSIIVNRPNRQRQVLTGLPDLARSIQTIGLINPPVVDREMNLIAGERRFTACRDILGWTSIPVQFAEDCDPAELHLIELEENVKRVDLPWADQCRAVMQYHSLRQSLDTEWTATATASSLGVKPMEVHDRLMVAKALDEGNPLVVNADTFSVARGVVQRQKQRKGEAEVQKIAELVGKPSATMTYLPDEELDETVESLNGRVAVPFRNCDFIEWTETYSGPKFNFLHCDFPYGINAGDHNQGAAGAFGGYEDGKDIYFELLARLLRPESDSFIAASAHIMFWFSMDYYHETKQAFEDAGWRVNPFPLVWFKVDNSGILPDPKRGPRRNYETAFLCSRGDRFIVQAVSNVAAHPNVKTIHMSEKNPDMLRHFFRMFIDESTIMLDPQWAAETPWSPPSPWALQFPSASSGIKISTRRLVQPTFRD